MLFQCTVGVYLESKRVLLFIARSNSSRSLYRSVSGCMLNHIDIRYCLFTNILEQSFSMGLMAWGRNWYVRILSRSQSTCGLRSPFTCNSKLLFYAPDCVSHCSSVFLYCIWYCCRSSGVLSVLFLSMTYCWIRKFCRVPI
jgi:hypothetical protein